MKILIFVGTIPTVAKTASEDVWSSFSISNKESFTEPIFVLLWTDFDSVVLVTRVFEVGILGPAQNT